MSYRKNHTPLLVVDTGNSEEIDLSDLFDNKKNEEKDFPPQIGILPVRNTVLFPGVVIPVTVSRKKALKLVKKANKGDKLIGVVAQKNPQEEEPHSSSLYQYGTIAQIIKMITLPDGNVTIIIQGKKRFYVSEFLAEDPYILANIITLNETFPNRETKEIKALKASLKDTALKILKLNPDIPQEAQIALENIDSLNFLTHFLASNLNAEVFEKQELLENNTGLDRANRLLELLLDELQMLELKYEIQNKAHNDMEQQQRDYFLRQQLKVLQDELGDEVGGVRIEELKLKAKNKKWSEAVAKHFEKELVRLQRANSSSPEYGISLNYIELLLDLPWGEYSEDNLDLKHAQEVLDTDHFGLEKVKERIIEHLAVLQLRKSLNGAILCLYGPPGVGKTSLGKSIAKAMGRKYIRLSLGGLHDEAEIRGHRKTYIGAMPGKIISNIKKAGTSNPIIILDEIDKIGADYKGDPASALLEVLDPEQNSTFLDNYLEVEYDLSKVLFIATANTLDTIHPALRDRMEIIELSGYTTQEKLQIAKKHLIKKQKENNGLKNSSLQLTDEAIVKIIEDYTRESGVRNLERQIGSLARKIAKNVAAKEDYPKRISANQVENFLGKPIFEKELYQAERMAGIVTGLAWTAAGGEILFIESSLSKGKGKFTLSGQLGEVMKESVITALSYLKAHADDLAIDYQIFDNYDLHVHIPAGAVPKDGPSAGITLLTSLASVYTQRKVKEKLAMTGEITLRGKVLPVGGIREKILAAIRAGITEVILSEKNQKDIAEIPAHYLNDLQIHYVKEAREVLGLALLAEQVEEFVELK
ncbi:MAG: endopeptidase La [Thermonemataceae bacterium]|nr:endopeptidase La [Thermonemataceae bacterium]